MSPGLCVGGHCVSNSENRAGVKDIIDKLCGRRRLEINLTFAISTCVSYASTEGLALVNE